MTEYIYAYDDTGLCPKCKGKLILYFHPMYNWTNFVCEKCKIIIPVEKVGIIYKIMEKKKHVEQ
jgi:predicted  nucleic acid-binding Zn ribbon protein